ncbi:hypothetical protein GGI23_005106, partial [Coemansia sp. RSA 2559]
MHFSQLLLALYNHHATRWRQRQEKRHSNKLSEANLDALPKFKLTDEMLEDIKRAHTRRRHLVSLRPESPQKLHSSKPANLHSKELHVSTASLPDINVFLSPNTCNGLAEDVVCTANADDSGSRYAPTEAGPPSCVICLEAYIVDDKVRVLPCGHVFHDQCIIPWLLRPKQRFHE